MDLMTGTTVGAYQVERRLGMGGMAQVYLVRHRGLGTLHALKMILAFPGASTDRLVLEGQVQARLKHPNVVDVTDLVEVDGNPGLILEYVHGFTLGEFLVQVTPTLDQVDALAQGILAGVRAAHAAGLVHRDLKPANILLQLDDEGLVPKVADFGLAKLVQDSELNLTRTGHAMGTPSYMAPEQIRDAKSVDTRADLFSLGAILYEIATGEQAFPGDNAFEIHTAICEGTYVPVRERAPELPDRMVGAIERALVVDRDERVATCEQLLALWLGVEQVAPSGPWDTGSLQQVHDDTAVAPTLSAVPISADRDRLSALIEKAEARSRGLAAMLPVSGSTLTGDGRGGVALAGVALLAGVFGLGWWMSGTSARLAEPEVVAPATVEPAPQPVVAEPEPEPEPVRQPEPEPEPEPVPVPAPAPVEAPVPRPVPRPQPAPAPAPAPVVEPEPEAEEPASPTGTVVVTGGATEVWLRQGDVEVPPGSDLAVGVYEVHAAFPDTDRMHVLDIRVLEGATTTVWCDAGFRRCKVR